MDVLVDALFDATRHSWIEMFFGKGLAGGAKDAVRRTRDTAMNPQVLDAFALAILATDGSPNFPGMPEANIDAAQARDAVRALDRATAAMYRLDPGAGSYLSESDFFLSDWKERYWGSNAARLALPAITGILRFGSKTNQPGAVRGNGQCTSTNRQVGTGQTVPAAIGQPLGQRHAPRLVAGVKPAHPGAVRAPTDEPMTLCSGVPLSPSGRM